MINGSKIIREDDFNISKYGSKFANFSISSNNCFDISSVAPTTKNSLLQSEFFVNYWDVSSAGLERYLDKVEVTGSNPVRPTKNFIRFLLQQKYFHQRKPNLLLMLLFVQFSAPFAPNCNIPLSN